MVGWRARCIVVRSVAIGMSLTKEENIMRKRIKTISRSIALGLFAPWVRQDHYGNPDAVGWRASVHVPWLGCIAFVRLDGTLALGW